MTSMVFHDVWMVVVPEGILVLDFSYICVWEKLFYMLFSVLSSASVITLGAVWCDHVFSVGRLLCMPYFGCAAACPSDTQVSPVVMNCSNPVLIGLVLAQ